MQEIQEYVAKVTHGATAEDPFEVCPAMSQLKCPGDCRAALAICSMPCAI